MTDSWYFQPEEDPFCSPEGAAKDCHAHASSWPQSGEGGLSQGSREGAGPGPGGCGWCSPHQRGKNYMLARKELLLKSAKPFYLYSESLLLILTSRMQLLISKSPSAL